LSGNPSHSDAERPHDQRSIDDHVRRDDVIGERVHPCVPSTQCDVAFNHTGTEIADDNEDQRQDRVARRFERGPPLDALGWKDAIADQAVRPALQLPPSPTCRLE